MAVIRPFIGTRFDTEKVGPWSNVLAPPYDVISEPMRAALCARSENNVVHIDFGKPGDQGDGCADQYERAAKLFAQWRDSGALIDEAEPCLYIYAQRYTLPDGREITRAGFFSAVELMELGPGGVMPHERTFEGPKADRLNLTRATHANFSAIFALYTDAEGRANRLIADRMAAEPPRDSATTDDGITHSLWAVSDPDFIAQMQAVLADQPLYIADGHHRYETAQNYAAECQREGNLLGREPEPSDHVLMYLVNTDDPGLEILPTHRVLHRDLAGDAEAFRRRAEEHFDVSPLGLRWDTEPDAAARLQRDLAQAGERGTSFAVLLPGGEGMMMTLKPDADLDAMIPEAMPREKKSLDATVLHAHVLSRCWLDDPGRDIGHDDCAYVRDIGEAMDLLRAGEHGVAFLMNSTTMDQLKAISTIGERMPQKSTYFFPKIATGVVLRDMGLPLG
ncbi:DUF1015 domain-containing protein [Candidatus Sumerlaeota bacterium]|nr:DUF1015 domain-containing protein [Candidatus Sumerlaeota bacterium]